MKPKYAKEWLSLAEAVEFVGGDAAALELAVQEEKVTPRISGVHGAPVHMVSAQMLLTARLDVSQDRILIQDTRAPWGKDIEHPAPKFSRSEIASAFGLQPTPMPDSAAVSLLQKKRRLRGGGRLRKQDWSPIDLFITAYFYELGIPSDSEVSKLTSRVQDHVDEIYEDPPGREELHTRVKTVLAGFTEKLRQVQSKGYT